VTVFLSLIIRVLSSGSVVIHSIDSFLLTKVIAAIESLLHPFEMVDYQFCQFLSTIDEFRNWKHNYLLHSHSPFLVHPTSLPLPFRDMLSCLSPDGFAFFCGFVNYQIANESRAERHPPLGLHGARHQLRQIPQGDQLQ
jgi:hypothetical protein